MPRTPTLFFGHGTPMLTLSKNRYTDAWRAMGKRLQAIKPRGIVCVSAHWYTTATGVLVATRPETIHDFGGFPKALFDVQYPAPGDPLLARRVQGLLAPLNAALTTEWGYDHGTWTVMRHLFPEANVPLIQLSIDAHLPAPVHYQLGQRLAPLREEGYLLVGSGNLVHNLPRYVRNQLDMEPFAWNAAFDARVRELLLAGSHAPLASYESLGPEARLAVPTPDHYLPLLYAAGAHHPKDKVTFPVTGFDGGSMSMLAVEFAA